MAKKIAIVHDDTKSANDLWEELRRLYTTSNHQASTNLINRPNAFFFEENKENSEKLLLTFLCIINEPRSYDQEITDEEKKTNLLRTLP